MACALMAGPEGARPACQHGPPPQHPRLAPSFGPCREAETLTWRKRHLGDPLAARRRLRGCALGALRRRHAVGARGGRRGAQVAASCGRRRRRSGRGRPGCRAVQGSGGRSQRNLQSRTRARAGRGPAHRGPSASLHATSPSIDGNVSPAFARHPGGSARPRSGSPEAQLGTTATPRLHGGSCHAQLAAASTA